MLRGGTKQKRMTQPSTLRTMANGKFKSELCHEGFDSDALVSADAVLDCDLTGSKISVEEVRRGKFELIDSVNGIMHWHPPGGCTTQVAYLNVLKRPLWLPPPYGFDPILAYLLRFGIMEGQQAVKDYLKTMLDMISLLAAFLLVLTFEIAFLDYYDTQDCAKSDFSQYLCNFQALCGVVSTMMSVTLVTYGVFVGGWVAMLPVESVTYKTRYFVALWFWIPVLVMTGVCNMMCFGLIIKVGLQTADYSEDFDWDKPWENSVLAVTVAVCILWALVMSAAFLVAFSSIALEVRARDLDLRGKWSIFVSWNTDVGFSDEFLLSIGVMTHEHTSEAKQTAATASDSVAVRSPAESDNLAVSTRRHGMTSLLLPF
jgi:hypothetical protein